MEEKNVLLSIKDLSVKFRVRGRILTAIRNVSLDIYENETIAIVGESGCGKSVLTKTFAGMLDGNGFIDKGEIIFNDDSLTNICAPMNKAAEVIIRQARRKLDEYSKLELGAPMYRAMRQLEKERQDRLTLSEEESAAFELQRRELVFNRTEAHNLKLTLDSSRERAEIRELNKKIDALDKQIKALDEKKKATIENHRKRPLTMNPITAATTRGCRDLRPGTKRTAQGRSLSRPRKETSAWLKRCIFPSTAIRLTSGLSC